MGGRNNHTEMFGSVDRIVSYMFKNIIRAPYGGRHMETLNGHIDHLDKHKRLNEEKEYFLKRHSTFRDLAHKDEYKQYEIAEILGVTQPGVNYLIKKGLIKRKGRRLTRKELGDYLDSIS